MPQVYHDDVFMSNQLIRHKRMKTTPKKLKQSIALLRFAFVCSFLP